MRETAESGDQLVWVPMTTCFAYSNLGEDCSGLDSECSADGDGPIDDGACEDLVCTYSCWDGTHHDEWCPNNNCIDANNYCETP
jgi:hypothetical protein